PTATRRRAGQSTSASKPAEPSSKTGGDIARNDTPGASPHDTFIHRDEMFRLARELGYDISPEQAAWMFDMLDAQRRGRIAKADIFRHFLPLVHGMSQSGTPSEATKGRGGLTKEPMSPRISRRSPSRSSGSRTPPRPMGTPPPSARRQTTSPSNGGRTILCSSSVATFNPTAPSSPQDGRKGTSPSTSGGTLRPISSPSRLRKIPSKFWLTPDRDGEDVSRGAGGPVTKMSKEVETLGVDAVLGELAEQDVDQQAGEAQGSKKTGDTDNLSANDSPMGNNEPGRAQDRVKGKAHDENVAGTSAATNGRSKSKLDSVSKRSDPAAVDQLADKPILEWTAADVLTWVRALPRGLGAFAEAEAFAKGRVNGKMLATLKLSDIKRKEFRHAKFKAKIPMALWVEIKQLQQTVPSPAAAEVTTASVSPSRFSPGQTIVDEAVNTPLCTVKQSVGQGAFGEVYQVIWTGIGADRGTTLAMKAVRLADVKFDERDGYRIILLEEILTAVRVKPHPNVVNVRFAHIMGFCSDNEEYFCFEDFVTGRDLEEVIREGEGELYSGTPAEVQGRLLSYSIQLARGLGHIHRCGVLHQDIKSANIMVSDDAEVLVTDFGFAAVGVFGPPTQTVQASCAVSVSATSPRNEAETEPTGRSPCDHGVPSRTSFDRAGAGRGDGRGQPGRDFDREDGGVPSVATKDGRETCSTGNNLRDTMKEAVGASGSMNFARTASGTSKPREAEERTASSCPSTEAGRDPATLAKRGQPDIAIEQTAVRYPSVGEVGDEGERPPHRDRVLVGSLKGYTPRYQSPEVSAIIEEKREGAARAKMAGAGAGPSPVEAPDPHPLPSSGIQDTLSRPRTPFTHRSDMWAAGVVILEMYAGGLANLPAGRGDNALDLLETLVGNTVNGPENGGDEVQEGLESMPQLDGRDENKSDRQRKFLRVDMPEGVLAILRDIFQREAGDRPSSLEVLAARLSATLGGMLEKKLAVLPSPTNQAPSPSFLREERPVYVDGDENHAKVGRLHMWLGKALSLKGDDRRGQAVYEYREGVRVLQESKADQRSPSMALFRWYLGKALLDAGEIDEAMPHLTEAVSIDPENAKYRHTLGLAKCVTGDEAGAREELLEAALLDEEDAEDRYRLRMKRIRERQRNSEEGKFVSDQADGAREDAGSQVAPSPKPSDVMNGGEPRAAMTAQGESATAKASFAESRLLALEKASVSTRTYALEKLNDYRSVLAIGKGFSDPRGGGVGTMDVSRIMFGDEIIRDSTTSVEERRFSVGDELFCGQEASPPSKPLEPLRCAGETFVIDGDLLPGQASLYFPGEAYTATTAEIQRRRTSADDFDWGPNGSAGSSFHVVHLRIDSSDNKPATMAPTAASPTEEVSSIASSSGGEKQLAPIDDKERRMPAGGVARGRGSPVEEVGSGISAGVSSGDSKVRGGSSPTRSLSPKQTRPLKISASPMRGEDLISILEAVGRAAMVGFHAHLGGAMRRLTWGPSDLTLIADGTPSACSTLREACMSGGLYRATGMLTGSGGQGQHLAEEKTSHASVVVDRILKLATQMAAAISHCHSRGVLLRDISPRDVLVTHQWDVILRPNYQHACEGQRWATLSVREQQQERPDFGPPCANPKETPLSAPFTKSTSSDYQARYLARIRSLFEPSQRLSGRALRLSTAVTSPLSPGMVLAHEKGMSSQSRTGGPLSTSPNAVTAGDCRGGCVDRGRGDSISATNASGDGDIAPPNVTACESDIWAWALMVVQMFSDEAWPPGKGQEGLQALEALLLRKGGVEAWTTDDVVSWVHDIGLWSEKTEREIRMFKIAGPQLLVPTCRRDIVEKLGLFIMDGELSSKLWESIAGGLQRWSVPPRLAEVLRRCLADSPDDRFATMEQVCKVFRDTALGSSDRGGGGDSTIPKNGESLVHDGVRAGTILNDIGVCFSSKGPTERAETYFKMALLASDDVVEAYYNLGLIYIAPAFNKFRQAKQAFDAATERMGKLDPRRKCSVELSKAAERKSSYYQSQEMMKALSGKYGSLSPKASKDAGRRGGANGGTTSIKLLGGDGTKREEPDDNNRRSSFPPAEHKPYSSWSTTKALGRSSLPSATFGPTGMEVAKASPAQRPLSAARSSTPSR
ncbi:unnamed protein product, partial [Scytosiphon promiscuus]